jgi:predicted ATP-dependent serine protease
MEIIQPFTCSKCGIEFAPTEGGRCSSCGKLYCLLHVNIILADGSVNLSCNDCKNISGKDNV